MDWLNNKKIDANLLRVANLTNGTFKKENEELILEGIFRERNYSISLKPKGSGKNKALYYHVQVESDCELRMVCVKRHVKSRLEAKINEMSPITLNDESFDMVHRIFVDNEDLGYKLLSIPAIVEVIKSIMEKYTEMRIKKDITLLKRYHVKLTEPNILLNTLENLTKLAIEIESLTEKVR